MQSLTRFSIKEWRWVQNAKVKHSTEVFFVCFEKTSICSLSCSATSEGLLTFSPPLKCFAHQSISELNLLLSEQPRRWVRMVQGKQGVETGWLDATISFVTGSEEQRQWLLQFVVLVNCWIGTGLLLWWDPCSYMWNKASSQKEGNSLLSIHGWPFTVLCKVFN